VPRERAVAFPALCLLAVLLTASASLAQSGGSYELRGERYGAGSSVPSTGGNYAVEGSAGDPSVATSSGGDFYVIGGFWGSFYGYVTGVNDGPPDILPQRFLFPAPIPNPFNPRTTIAFDLPTGEQVSLRIYNVRGELVSTLIDEFRPPGSYRLDWDGRDGNGRSVASGVYLVRIQAGPYSGRHKISLAK